MQRSCRCDFLDESCRGGASSLVAVLLPPSLSPCDPETPDGSLEALSLLAPDTGRKGVEERESVEWSAGSSGWGEDGR